MAFHLDLAKIRVDPPKKEAWDGCLKKTDLRDVQTCFVPIKKKANSVESPQCYIITLSKTDCSLFDVVNTLAYLRGDDQKRDDRSGIWIPLHQRRDQNRPYFEVWEGEDYIKIRLHRDSLYISESKSQRRSLLP